MPFLRRTLKMMLLNTSECIIRTQKMVKKDDKRT